MATLILLRGNSGSGKSSVARALQRALGRNTLMIPQDTVRREMLWARDGENPAALPLLSALLYYGKGHCRHVILEGILDAAWYKPLFETAAELFGDRLFAYYYDLPFEETLRRHQTKEKRAEFGEAEMRRWWKGRDLIGFLPEKIFQENVSMEEAVETILRDIGQPAPLT